MAEDNIHMVEAAAAESTPDLPDYLTNPNAVVGDVGVEWRYGKPPDYSKTRKEWQRTKQMSHVAGSLPQLAENLVKNWEIEASFKPRLQDWRTIDHNNYSFAMNGGPPQSAEHMLKVGTYNAIICPNEYYSPEHSDFAASHKTFKRMMPTFAWEVLEVYSGPPTVAFKWRHWGEMKSDYVAFNDKGEKVTAKAHGGPIEIFGVTVAKVDDKVRLQGVETWMDPLSMFRQIAPYGIVNKESVDQKIQTVETKGTGDDLNSHASHPEQTDVGQGVNQDVSGEPLSPSAFTNPGEEAEPSTIDSHSVTTCPFLTHSRSSTEVVAVDEEEHITAPTPDATSNNESLNIQRSGTTQDTAVDLSQVMAEDVAGRDLSTGCIPEEDVWHEAAEMSFSQPQSIDESDISVVPDTKTPKSSDPVDSLKQSSPVNDAGEADISSARSHDVPRSIYSSSVTGDVEDILDPSSSEGRTHATAAASTKEPLAEETTPRLLHSASKVHAPAKNVEEVAMPDAGEAVVAPPESREVQATYEEMSTITPTERDNLMNQE